APPRRSARQEHRRRRDQLEDAAREDQGARRRGREGRRRSLQRSLPLAAEGLLVPSHVLRGSEPVVAHRARGDLRPGAHRSHVSNARRGDREGEQHDVRPLRRHLDRQGREDLLDGHAPQGRRRLGEHLQQVRSELAVRRIQGERLRPRGRPPGPPRLRGARVAMARKKTGTTTPVETRSQEDLLSDTYSDDGALAAAIEATARVGVNKAYKMFVGGAFVRSESGRYFQVTGRRDGADPDTVNIPRGSRKDVRDAVLAAKNAESSWAGRTAFNRGQI